jgi:hypothetical protein
MEGAKGNQTGAEGRGNAMTHLTAEDMARGVDDVCHDEQMVIWSGDLVGALALEKYIRDGLSYDEVLDLHEIVKREIRSIVEAAFELALAGEAPR